MPDKSFSREEKALSRIGEKIEDNAKLIEEALFDSPPVKFLSDGNTSMVAPIHSHHLLNEATDALKHNNREEAAHQLRREVDFCNMVPKMAGTPYEKAGQAGLKALREHESMAETDKVMEKAWKEAWAKDPAPFYKTD